MRFVVDVQPRLGSSRYLVVLPDKGRLGFSYNLRDGQRFRTGPLWRRLRAGKGNFANVGGQRYSVRVMAAF